MGSCSSRNYIIWPQGGSSWQAAVSLQNASIIIFGDLDVSFKHSYIGAGRVGFHPESLSFSDLQWL